MAQRPSEPRDATTALRRFGLGPRPGEIAHIASDPRGFVSAQLSKPAAARIENSPELEPSPMVFAALEEARIEQVILRTFGDKGQPQTQPAGTPPAAQPAMAASDAAMAPAGSAPAKAKPSGQPQPVGKVRRDALREETFARINRALETETPFLERLVYFWSNHFCVSTTKGPVRALAGSFEREAIRPHVLGSFADMLSAVEHHPAMLIFLDNVQSIGPNSPSGIGKDRGLNENLAREILELHTLGVDGGYTQADVTNFARIITGWTYGQGEMVTAADQGRFIFTPNRHEPGAFEVLGRTYAQPGRQAGEAVLADLVRHPATARNIARRLARHFVSDTPPPALVQALETSFRDSHGDLAAVTRTLIEAPEAWSHPAAKIVPPFEFTVSLVRGFGVKMPPPEINRLCNVLGQPLWQVSSPKGWPDNDDAWMGPSPIRERLRIAEQISKQVPPAADPRLVLADLAGPAASDHTRQAVARAQTREQAFELMIMSPEFMRR